MSSWQALKDECARWRDVGRTPELWWRDDDAQQPAPALERLLTLSARYEVPLALAVVPAGAGPELFARLGDTVQVLQHGADHRNRAAAQEKKSEFPASEPVDEALARLHDARARLEKLAGDRFVAVLAPPWNRLADALAPRLVAAGYRGLSRFGERRTTIRRLCEVNTHVDIVAWRGDRGFVGEAAALQALLQQLASRRAGAPAAFDPAGLLTHHAVHDDAAWRFIERLLETTRATTNLRWRAAQELFHA
jgi:hypothetical protein